jgi:hypothetical protein
MRRGLKDCRVLSAILDSRSELVHTGLSIVAPTRREASFMARFAACDTMQDIMETPRTNDHHARSKCAQETPRKNGALHGALSFVPRDRSDLRVSRRQRVGMTSSRVPGTRPGAPSRGSSERRFSTQYRMWRATRLAAAESCSAMCARSEMRSWIDSGDHMSVIHPMATDAHGSSPTMQPIA